MLVVENQEYFDTVITFAKQIGMYERPEGESDKGGYLLDKLEYLRTYGGDGAAVRVILFKDFAPNSFEFVLEKRVTNPERQARLLVAGHRVQHGILWERWFNGGLIFHGAHDGGGDGGAPTFSVNITPQSGWRVHT